MLSRNLASLQSAVISVYFLGYLDKTSCFPYTYRLSLGVKLLWTFFVFSQSPFSFVMIFNLPLPATLVRAAPLTWTILHLSLSVVWTVIQSPPPIPTLLQISLLLSTFCWWYSLTYSAALKCFFQVITCTIIDLLVKCYIVRIVFISRNRVINNLEPCLLFVLF